MKRVRRRAARCAVAAVLCSATSCSETPQPLLGEWITVGGQAPRLTYVFEDGGRMRWILDLEEGPDTFAVGFRTNHHATPAELDVGPWTSGPLSGRTLTGIVEMQGPDRFRVDFEPSDPDGVVLERPAQFSEQTLHFVRKLN